MFLPIRIDALLRPGEIRVTRRPALLPKRGGEVRRQSVSPWSDGEPWGPCVDGLGELLTVVGKATSLHVVVSDHFLRYALVPWSANLVADAERLAFARLTFAETYGTLADRWALTMDQQPAGQASLACAMDRDLLQALQEMASRRGVRLRSVGAALGERITRHRKALKDAVFCFASLEPGRLTLAFHNESGWIAVRTRRVDNGLAELLPGALKQEAAAAGATEGGTLYLVGESLVELPPTPVPGWKVIRIDEPSPTASPAAASAPARMAAAD